MGLMSRLVSRWMKLPPAETHDLVITRDLRVPLPDGTILLADRYAPLHGPRPPTILIRSPYGRRGYISLLYARTYAERGYQVVIQSCRGTDGSQGQFVYARQEQADGLATLAWLKQQEWFSGELAMVGESYLGFTQWSVAALAGPELKAIFPVRTAADFNHFRFPGKVLLLEMLLDWTTGMTRQTTTHISFLRMVLEQNRQKRRLIQAFGHLPLKEADTLVIDQPSEIFQEVLAHGPDDAYWQAVDHSGSLKDVLAPVHLVAGWYDLLLYWQLQDYQALREAGRQPYLLIGPWTHANPAGTAAAAREALSWLPVHLGRESHNPRENHVRFYVMGANEWRDCADWPPPASVERWHLQPGGGFKTEMPPVSEPDRYRYDPADPTPSVGGNTLGATATAGPQDNRPLESRADVLVYTSAVLEEDLEIIGPLVADLYVTSSLEHTDFFARLCAVDAAGKSLNICDNILRLLPGQVLPQEDGVLHIQIELWPTAYRFLRGQRLRMQISSGAHPRFARNPGTGEALASGMKLLVADQALYHDPDHPSAILLPVYKI